jgi:multidrug efflux pump subunit AcrA (membrane-fusion protein)
MAKIPRGKIKIKKKWLIISGVVVLVVILALAIGGALGRSGQSSLSLSDTTLLEKHDISDTISATGTVESATSMAVYSSLAYPVKSVSVEVGDYVEQGDLLAELDGETIAEQIESQETALGVANNNSSQQIKAAEDNYQAYLYALEHGLNPSIISGQSQVTAAYDTYITAQQTFTRYQESLEEDENTLLLTQEAALDSAKSNREAAKEAYDAAKAAQQEAAAQVSDQQAELTAAQNDLLAAQNARAAALALDPLADVSAYDSQISSLTLEIATLNAELAALQAAESTAASQLSAARRAYDLADSAYDTAKSQYNAALTSVDNALADYAEAVDRAYENYLTALDSLAAAQKAATDQLQVYANALASTKAGADNATNQVGLRQLRADLADTRLKAPISGTVTAVYAKVGASGSGLLFVIEDLENLVVTTSVKEYDIATVSPGMAVIIKSDATGDQEFPGLISKIAPTAAKTALGETDTLSDALFDTEVSVTPPASGLKIGMGVRLDFIVSKQSEVLTVPYDAVYENAAGEECVLVATEQSDGKYLVSELPVMTSRGNDLYTVIEGEDVKEGLRVINAPQDYLPLIGQEISISEQQQAAMSGIFMPGVEGN